MKKTLPRVFSSFMIFVIPTAQVLFAQQQDYLAMIPAFHDKEHQSGSESVLRLTHQRFILFVYQNAVAVYSEADFYNTSAVSLEREIALPSTGHDENDNAPGGKISNGILGVQLWVEDEQIAPNFISDNNEAWCTIPLNLEAYEGKKVKALFWSETSLSDVDSISGLDTTLIASGKRGFMIDLWHSANWNNEILSVDVTAVLTDGVSPQQKDFDATPENYLLVDSTLTWTYKNIEPTEDDNIFVYYSTGATIQSIEKTMANISPYFIKTVYGKLLRYASGADD